MPRRFKRKGGGEKERGYVAPSLEGSSSRTTAASPRGASSPAAHADYVTQPPKRQGLTGKISTLFRQKSSSTAGGDEDTTTVTTTREQQQQQQRQHRQQHHRSSKNRSRSRSADNISVDSRSSHHSRIFYSSHQDDDSDDSYESRISRGRSTAQTTVTDEYYHDDDDSTVVPVVRYRGFSTSIQSLFLDEPLVCASMGCFGLILSNRTEYLLDIRSERRGLLVSGSSTTTGGSSSSSAHHKKKRSRLPSRIVAYALLLTVLLMFGTFLVWGFGSGRGSSRLAEDYWNGFDYYDDDAAAAADYYNNDDNNNNNANWDDYLQNDDQYNNNNNANDDAYQNQDDQYQQNYNGDDGNNANADDYYSNYYQNYNNDDAVANDDANNNDDDQAANDDANNNDDAAAADDYYYAANDDAGRMLKRREKDAAVYHPPHGIFKLRDYQEHLWNPLIQCVVDEYKAELQQQRRAEERYYSQQQQKQPRDIGALVRIGLLLAFLLFLGVLGRRRRMRTRFYIVRARAQEDHLYYASSDQAARRRVAFDRTREDQYEGACSHTLCGCYPTDEDDLLLNQKSLSSQSSSAQVVEVTDTGIFRRKATPHHQDIVARTFACLSACCCGFLCKCWFQCMSVCALAQEAREIRLLLPPRYQRVDFITHQPFHEYQKDVNDLRRGWMGQAKRLRGIMPHYNALSRLSRYIVVVFVVSTVAIVTTLIFNPRAVFSWQDAVVLLATFVQSFLVLFVVHGIFHKSDLSLDAVIKLFAAGFLIAVPTAVCFEGLLVNLSLFAGWILYLLGHLVAGEWFSDWVYAHWRAIWLVSELFNAFVVAAITEELCKYYTFRAVEHPDLVFLTGLQRESQDETAVDGGLVKYPFASHQVQNFIKDQNDDQSSATSSRKSRKQQLLQKTGTTDAEFDEDERDMRTYRQKAMAITTGMISVAVGLACAENFLYVFLLGGALGGVSDDEDRGSSIVEAWLVLFFRSVFPVHALAAAMQSVNMIRKFVESTDERGHRIGVGRIVLPAIILHGSFDAILMSINVFVETAWDQYYEENGVDANANDDDSDEAAPYNVWLVNVVAWTSISLIMVIGMLWYYRENRAQSLRLKLLEERDKELVEVQEHDDYVAQRQQQGRKTTSSPTTTTQNNKPDPVGRPAEFV